MRNSNYLVVQFRATSDILQTMNNGNEESLVPNEIDLEEHASSDDEIMENENDHYQAVSISYVHRVDLKFILN